MAIFFIEFILTAIILFLIIANLKFVRRKSKISEYLQDIKEKDVIENVDDFIETKKLGDRIEDFFNSRVSKYMIKNKKEEELEYIKRMLWKVYKGKKTYNDWETERVIGCVVIFCACAFIGILLKLTLMLIIALALPIFFYKFYLYNLKKECEKVNWEYFVFFPNIALSIAMLYQTGAVSVIMLAFKKICELYKHPLIDEIQTAVDEYDANKDKYDVLRDLAKRVDEKEFSSFINLVSESEKNGIPIADVITDYAFSVSAKRKVLANAQIDKIPQKLEVIMLFTAMPIVFIYMILPTVISSLQSLNNL